VKLKSVFFKTLAFLPYFIVFLGSLYNPDDPDLGWHLKYGEYFFRHGTILRDNTFSTLMPNYHWANGSWGTDVISYLVIHFAGFFGLTILSACIVTLTFYFIAKTAKFTILDQVFFFPLLLYIEQLPNSFSFRGQQITMLFIVILFWLISQYMAYVAHGANKKRGSINPLFFTIPLFLVVTLFRSGVEGSCQKRDPGPGMRGKAEHHGRGARQVASRLRTHQEA